MNGYEKLLRQMRTQGAKGNEKGVFLGTMLSDKSVKAGELILEREDLLFAQHLITGYLDKNANAVSELKKGDKVLLKRLSEQTYAVIEKVI